MFTFLKLKVALAQNDIWNSGGGGGKTIDNPLRYGSLSDLLTGIAGQLYIIAIPIVTIMVLYGAWLILTAAGDPARLGQGKKTILYAIIGFIIVLIAGGIPALITQILS